MLRVRPGREADESEISRFVPGIRGWATAVSALGPLVATRDEVVVGVVVRWPHPDHVLLERLAVAPHERRGGIGSALLDAVEREAIEAGVNAVRAPGSGGCVPMLLRHGYAVAQDGMLERRL